MYLVITKKLQRSYFKVILWYYLQVRLWNVCITSKSFLLQLSLGVGTIWLHMWNKCKKFTKILCYETIIGAHTKIKTSSCALFIDDIDAMNCLQKFPCPFIWVKKVHNHIFTCHVFVLCKEFKGPTMFVITLIVTKVIVCED